MEGIGCEAVHQRLEKRQLLEGEAMAREGVDMQLRALLGPSPTRCPGLSSTQACSIFEDRLLNHMHPRPKDGQIWRGMNHAYQ